jgi:hypothetical protein
MSLGISSRKKQSNILDNQRVGQRKQAFFNQLNEAFAYRYLIRKGFKNIRFIKEGKEKSPDIRFVDRRTVSYCEVKTIGISDDEINRRAGQSVSDGAVYLILSPGFLNKLTSGIDRARKQIQYLGENGLIFFLIRFDGIALDHYRSYRKQLTKFSQSRKFENLVLKGGVSGNRRICI